LEAAVFGVAVTVTSRMTQRYDRMRAAYYRRRLGVERLDIHFPVFLKPIENIVLGENVAINAFVHVWANARVSIGRDTMIASHVQISSSTHDYDAATMRDTRIDLSVTIGHNVWIGSGAIILPGVVIGDNSVIGAGSVVTHDIPADSLAYGVPARVHRVFPSRSAAGT
jgi:acetyltransferase-like isoleucine patch superfamily enzyme